MVWIGGSLFILFSLVLGGRLLWLARRTRQLPELVMGIAFVSTGCVGAALDLAGYTAFADDESLRALCKGASRISIHLGVAAQALFTWRVFRPQSAASRALFVAIVAALVAIAAGYANAGVLGAQRYYGPWFWAKAFVHPAAIAWGSVESLRYHGLMRRRLRLGLADPVLANRFLVWGVAIAAGAVALCVGPVNRLATGGGGSGLVLAIAAPVGLVSAVGYWLTFFPPARYGTWLRRRAAGATTTDGG